MLKAIVTKEEHAKLPKELQAEYADVSGKLVLAVESVDGYALEPVGDLKAALSTERENAKRYAKDIERFKDIDPDKAREAFVKLEKLGKSTGDEKIKELVDAQVKQVTDKYEPELKKRDDSIKMLTGEVSRLLVDSEAARIVGDKGSVELLLPYIRANTRVEQDAAGKFVTRVVNEQGVPQITKKSGSQDPMSLAEFVTGTQTHPSYARAWNSSGASGIGGGSGTGTGSGGNRRFEISEQAARNDPTAYQAVRAEAKAAGQQVVIVPT